MLTTTSTYALIAISTMVRNESRLPMTARELAELGQIPTNYLSKIMRQLVRANLIDGARGIGGGFRFARPPSEIKLIEIVDLFEEVDRPRVCPFGNLTCDDRNPCAVHDLWGGVRNSFITVLAETDLATAAKEPKRKGKRGGAAAKRPRAKGKAKRKRRT
ncbi:MAG: Rrf2 family transcriptional regulator [Planctomycetes bacterium]|nr:Rrf2 family transcriptional regulator [Planctomycetota bacterium]